MILGITSIVSALIVLMHCYSIPASRHSSSDDSRMIRCQVTDGHIICNALEFQYIPTLPHKPAPGTKIVITNARTRGGHILLTPAAVKVLGGKIPPARSDWDVNRTTPTQEGDAPPPFVLPTEVCGLLICYAVTSECCNKRMLLVYLL